MLIRRISLVLSLALPIVLLTSIGCGILTLPLEAPKVALVNSKLIIINSDIVDESGEPLEDVRATITLHSISTNIFFPEAEDVKSEGSEKINGTFKHTSFGHYAAGVTFDKPGFVTRTILYSLEDHVVVRSSHGWGDLNEVPFPDADRVNTIKTPHSRIVLTKNP